MPHSLIHIPIYLSHTHKTDQKDLHKKIAININFISNITSKILMNRRKLHLVSLKKKNCYIFITGFQFSFASIEYLLNILDIRHRTKQMANLIPF